MVELTRCLCRRSKSLATDMIDAPFLISRSSRGTLASNPVRSAYAVMRREGFENPVREPVVAHELPDIFLRVQFRAVQFRAFGRQRDQRDIGRTIRLPERCHPA